MNHIEQLLSEAREASESSRVLELKGCDLVRRLADCLSFAVNALGNIYEDGEYHANIALKEINKLAGATDEPK